MKKSIKILSGGLAFLLIIVILYFANGLLGNPISKTVANNVSKEYIAKNYQNMKLNLSNASYSFKTGDYYVQVKSPISKDTHFSLTISPLGKIIGDTYESDVLGKFNTLTRIDKIYNDKVNNVIESKEFTYKSDIYFGELSEDMLDRNKLELDKDYNLYELGKKAGHIVLYIQDEDVSFKKASEILLDIKSMLDKQSVSFYSIDFTLQKPRNENGELSSDDSYISVEKFLYKDIYEEDLENRVLKSYEDLQKYYKEQDLKKEEILN
ncbi:YfjL-like protein [Romboutsia sp. 1001713B170207_170306_H8]|uniref:YfjL-like protein n=1 Tax=Romboutsia sp. 1001713B170207_170306_H8 TaxID=2787112 RepID=UPI000820D5F2|nr:hypothetical protein [Romboutsia sp. 1001713B170207_170306_H8]SCG99321.1 Uncharacterised protein [uncultured Clostridium sp.]